jgi:benzodiazapine receptor
MNSTLSYIIAFSACAATAMVPSAWMKETLQSKWYQCIKPSFTPPSIVFPIVWTALYTMLAVSLAYILQMSLPPTQYYWILAAFAINLALNIAWTWAYFGMRQPMKALIVIVLLWLSIIALIVLIHPVNPMAAYLLIPYLIWVAFAAVLNVFSVMADVGCK